MPGFLGSNYFRSDYFSSHFLCARATAESPPRSDSSSVSGGVSFGMDTIRAFRARRDQDEDEVLLLALGLLV